MQALDAIIHEDQPCVESVYYEGALLDVLDDLPSSGSVDETYALGKTVDRLPDIDREVRASFVRKVMGFATEHYPALQHTALHASMLSTIQKLTGGKRVKLFQDMAMIKPPGGREKPWHQDHA